MPQFLHARGMSLDELHTQFGLQNTSDQSFFLEWPRDSLDLSEIERQQLNRVQKNYFNLASRKTFSEEVIKMVVLAPLLDLAGFYQAPFGKQTEESVDISADDNKIIVKGKIDVIVVCQYFGVLVIESKSTQFDVLTALPQALTYMLGNPSHRSFFMVF